MENTETEIKERTPIHNLLYTAKALTQFRIDTFDPNGEKTDEYLRSKQEELEKLTLTTENVLPCDLEAVFPGIMGESIFLLMCREGDIPIFLGSGTDDYHGIDFYLAGHPIDVTTTKNPQFLSRKINSDRAQLICLPKYIKLQDDKNTIKSTTEAYIQNQLSYTQYFLTLLRINYQLRSMLSKNEIEQIPLLIKPKYQNMKSNRIWEFDNILDLISRRLQ